MIISSKKYACETCIKGHRSSACKHTDRPLYEIKKKGRPVTQCEHCRELRKTKQVHVKCICESKDDSSSSYQQGPKPGFEGAAFPNGLPQALEASVAFQSLGEGTSSDSDHGGVRHGHKCKSGDPCSCVTSRTRTRARDGALEQHSHTAGSGPSRDPLGHSSSHNPLRTPAALIRIAELRTILPRPAQDGRGALSGPVHDPSTGRPHGHGGRHHYSKPYKSANHGMTHQHVAQPSSYPPPGPSNPSFAYNEQAYNSQHQMMGSENNWVPSDGNANFAEFPSLCGCGDDCNCPGCIHHNRSTVPSSSAYPSCRNPEICATCLDCSILSSMPSAFLPADTALSIYNSDIQNQTIDDWLRQMSPAFTSDIPSSPPMHQGFPIQDTLFQQPPPGWNQRPGGFPFSGQPSNVNPMLPGNYGYVPSSGPTMVPFGASNGSVFPNQPSRGHRSHGCSIDESVIDPRLLPQNGGSPFLRVPDSDSHRSRSPSTSSQSSQQGSDGHGGGSVPPYRPSGRMQGLYPNSHSGRPAPQLNIRPSVQRGPSSGSSSSISPSPGSSSTRSPFPSSSPDNVSSEYDPSLAGLHIY